MLELERETIKQDIFKKLYSLLNDKAVSIINSQGDTVQLQSRGGHRWMGSYPNPQREKEGRDRKVKFIDSKDSYPFGVIPSPDNNENITGFRSVEGSIVVRIAVYSTKSEHAEKFAEKAWAVVSNNEDEFRENGFVQQVEQGRTETDTILRGKNMKIHEKIVPLNFNLFGVR